MFIDNPEHTAEDVIHEDSFHEEFLSWNSKNLRNLNWP